MFIVYVVKDFFFMYMLFFSFSGHEFRAERIKTEKRFFLFFSLAFCYFYFVNRQCTILI